MKNRKKLIDTLATGDGTTIQDVGNKIVTYAKIVKANYSQIAQKIDKVSVDTSKLPEIPVALDDATTGNAKEIKQLLGGDNTTAKDLVDAMPIINDMVSKTKGKTQYSWNVLKKSVDKELKNSIDPETYKLWKSSNKDYAKMSQLVNSKIGETIRRTLGMVRKSEKLTSEEAIRKISKLDGGDNTFKNLAWLTGNKTAAAFERMTIKEALGKGSENVSWAQLARNVEKKGFVTEEGKQLQNLITTMRDTFATDDKLKDIWFQNRGLSAGMSDSILSKIRFSFVGRAFDILVKHIPFNETATHMRRMSDLQAVLRSPTKLKAFEKALSEASDGVKLKIMEDVVKKLEYKGPVLRKY